MGYYLTESVGHASEPVIAADLQKCTEFPFLQVCRQPGIALLQKHSVYRVSANRFFG